MFAAKSVFFCFLLRIGIFCGEFKDVPCFQDLHAFNDSVTIELIDTSFRCRRHSTKNNKVKKKEKKNKIAGIAVAVFVFVFKV